MATPLAADNHRQPTAGAMGLLVVGLAGLFSSLLIYSGTVISFLRFPLFDLAFGPAGYMALFAETTLLASTVLGAAIAMASLRKRRPLPFMVLGALAAVAYLCCSLGFGFACYFQVTIPEVYPLLGTAAAVADCGMVLVWGRVCARRLTMRPALVVVGLASVLSAAFCFLYSWLPLEGMLALFFVGSTLAAVIPLAVHDSRGGVGDEGSAASASVAGRVAAVPADAADEAGEAGEADAPDARSRIASLFEVVGTPSLGLVSFAFVMAVMRTSFNESQSLYLAALALSGTRPVSAAGWFAADVPARGGPSGAGGGEYHCHGRSGRRGVRLAYLWVVFSGGRAHPGNAVRSGPCGRVLARSGVCRCHLRFLRGLVHRPAGRRRAAQ